MDGRGCVRALKYTRELSSPPQLKCYLIKTRCGEMGGGGEGLTGNTNWSRTRHNVLYVSQQMMIKL